MNCTTCQKAPAAFHVFRSFAPARALCPTCAEREPSFVVKRPICAGPGGLGPRRKFVLEGRVTREAALGEWAAWLESHVQETLIARTSVTGQIHVRTDFVGLETCLFETAVFGGPLCGEALRYDTIEQAEAGHTAMVERVRGTLERFPREGSRS